MEADRKRYMQNFWKERREMSTTRNEDEILEDETQVLIDLVSELTTSPQAVFRIIEDGIQKRVVDGKEALSGKLKPHWLVLSECDLASIYLKRKRMIRFAQEREDTLKNSEFHYEREDEQC